MRSSAPRRSRISSTTARYSRSSSRVRPSTGTSSWRSSTSTRSRPEGSAPAAPATPRATPSSSAPCTPPGRRMRSDTRATVPTEAYSPSWRGTRSTNSSSPVSTGSVTSMVGKTTVSSRGIRRSRAIAHATIHENLSVPDSGCDALFSRVEVDVGAPGEAGQRHAAIGGELDGQRRGGAHADQDRRARHRRLLNELERDPTAHAQDPALQRQLAVEQGSPDDLVHRVVAPHVLPGPQQDAV